VPNLTLVAIFVADIALAAIGVVGARLSPR
jgi:hypothetical protein